MVVIYAFNRYTDDLVDDASEFIPPEEQYALLDDWQNAVDWALGSSVENAETSEFSPCPTLEEMRQAYPDLSGVELLPALRFMVDKFDIPRPVFSEVIYGVRSDVESGRFWEYEDFADYCHQVATSVGVASLAIWGTKEPLFSDHVVKEAKACGIAIQLTNILRDLREDMLKGQFYLPQSEMQLAQITEKQILSLMEYEKAGRKKPRPKKGDNPYDVFAENEFQSQLETFYKRFDRLIAKQLDRVETNYLIGADLYGIVQPDARKAFGMIWDIYYHLYQKIRRRPRLILARKIRLSRFEKIRLWLRWKFFPPKKLRY